MHITSNQSMCVLSSKKKKKKSMCVICPTGPTLVTT